MAWATNDQAKAWGTQVEEDEAAGEKLGPQAPVSTLGGDDAFPELGAAVAGGGGKKRGKAKGKAISLAEFTSGANTARGSAFVPSASRAPPEEDILTRLPTGPRERSDEDRGKGGGLGGAFSRGFGRDRDDADAPARAPREDDGPSKADMSDDWSRDRKFVPGGTDRGTGGGFGSRSSFEPSRADESSSWSRGRPASRDGEIDSSRASSRGGFDDRGDAGGPSRADTEDRWGNRSFVSSTSGGFGPSRRESEDRWGSSRRSSSPPPPAGARPRLALKPRTLPAPDLPPPKSSASSETGDSVAEPANTDSLTLPSTRPTAKSDPFGGAKPRDELRHRLESRSESEEPPQQPEQLQAAPDSLSVQPTKAAIARSNPFGAARPREEVLKEQGRDHSKEDAAVAHKGVDRPETQEEVDIRNQISELQAQLEAGTNTTTEQSPDKAETQEESAAANGTATGAESSDGAGEAGTTEEQQKLSPEAVKDQIASLEGDLEKLILENDDKHRFATAKSGRW